MCTRFISLVKSAALGTVETIADRFVGAVKRKGNDNNFLKLTTRPRGGFSILKTCRFMDFIATRTRVILFESLLVYERGGRGTGDGISLCVRHILSHAISTPK